MNIESAIKKASFELKKKNIKTALLDSEILMSKVLKEDRSSIILNSERILSNQDYIYFRKLISNRLRNKPVAYLIGKKSFWKYEFELNDKVLILPCGEQKHYFHCDYSETCSGILPWLKENNTCPICRYSFPIDNDTNNDMNHDDNDDNTLSEDNQQIPINNNQQIPINNNQQIPINNIFQHMNNMMTRVIDEERRNMLNEEEELQRAILNSIEES